VVSLVEPAESKGTGTVLARQAFGCATRYRLIFAGLECPKLELTFLSAEVAYAG
jgi:hypothetical protein